MDKFWHSKACLLGDCKNCGVTTMLQIYLGELNNQKLVIWMCFGQETIGANNSCKDRKVVKLDYKKTTAAKLNDFSFVKHNFLAMWQDTESKEQLNNLLGPCEPKNRYLYSK